MHLMLQSIIKEFLILLKFCIVLLIRVYTYSMPHMNLKPRHRRENLWPCHLVVRLNIYCMSFQLDPVRDCKYTQVHKGAG